MRRAPPTPPRSASGFVTTVDDDGAEADVSRDEVGFENTTVLYSSSATPFTTTAGETAAASAAPFAFYEPLHAQQQGVLDGVAAAGGGGGNSSTSSAIFPNPPAPSSLSAAAGILGPGALSPPPPPHPPHVQQSAQSYVEEGLDVPLHAPRLRVPTDLPLEQTTLLDLLAMMVVQGGPTTEEEIVKREMARRNPAFAFLGEKYNHPALLYYRWRLYSLLQQDTLLCWRTAPFQVEQARRAYVFVPPPALWVGPECLAALHQPEALLSAASSSSVQPGVAGGVKRGREAEESERDSNEKAEEGEEIVVVRKARRRHRRHASSASTEEPSQAVRGEGSAEALVDVASGAEVAPARQEGSEDAQTATQKSGSSGSDSSSGSSSGSSSSSGSESDGESGAARAEANASQEAKTPVSKEDGDAAASAEARRNNTSDIPQDASALVPADATEPSIPLPPPSAQWISRQCVLNKHVFTVLPSALCEEWVRLLNPRSICPVTACQSVGELCERWLCRGEVAARMAFAVEHADGIHHVLSILLDAVVRTAYVATARTRAPLPSPLPPSQATSSLEADSAVYCVEALFYLYVLHDILMNASNMPRGGGGAAAAASCCVNKNHRAASSTAHTGEEEEGMQSGPPEGSQEALEALYLAFKAQKDRASLSSSLSPAAAGPSHVRDSSIDLHSAPHAPPQLPPLPGLPPSVGGNPQRHRRRQRTTRRRSPYERCGDALELILPTLLEAVTAVALAVSLDKERLPQQPTSPQSQPPPTAAATGEDTDPTTTSSRPSPPPPRVHHFKVLNPAQSQRQQRKKNAATSGAGEATLEGNAAAVSAVGGGPSLSLRLDAGCSALDDMVAEGQQHSEDNASDGAPQPSPSSSSSSAPAILLLEWLKALVLVWMNVEQPLRLPLPTATSPPSPRTKLPENEEDTAAVIAATPPPGLLWPDTAAGASDTPDVQLSYYVDARHAHVLGLEATLAASAGGHGHGLAVPVQALQAERSQPPLLSARACAILKDRYSFLF